MILPIVLLTALPPSALRLPDGATPRWHHAELTLDPSKAEFEGRMEIEVRFQPASATLWLNARDLVIQSVAWNHSPAPFTAVDNELLRIDLPREFDEGVVDIEYRARLSDSKLVGAYRRQVGADWYAFTTFTAIEARRAFPCFDDPRFKTPWRLTLRVPQALTAASNYPVLRVEAEGEWKKVVFAETAPLPAEVIAFAVGPFDVYEGPPAGRNRVPVRVLAPKGRRAEALYAAEASDGVVRWLEERTAQPYPWPKLDHVALPAGAFGAVENPGLITYLQSALLATASSATPDWRRRMTNLQTHELAHQWFGNLVTQADWSDVWLSEGFATFMAAKHAADGLAIVDARERIMTADSGARSRPVRKIFADRAGMQDIYSRFVYEKGAATLFELESWLGEEKLWEGLRRYLALHKAGSARTADLADALGGSSQRVLAGLLDESGPPSVRGEIVCETGAARFRVRLSSPRTEPVCFSTAGVAKTCVLLENGSAEQDFAGASCPAWLFINAGARGYYRSAYSAAQLDSVVREAWATLGEDERLTLVFDVAEQVRQGSLSVEQARPLAHVAAQDAEPRVVEAAERLAPK